MKAAWSEVTPGYANGFTGYIEHDHGNGRI